MKEQQKNEHISVFSTHDVTCHTQVHSSRKGARLHGDNEQRNLSAVGRRAGAPAASQLPALNWEEWTLFFPLVSAFSPKKCLSCRSSLYRFF